MFLNMYYNILIKPSNFLDVIINTEITNLSREKNKYINEIYNNLANYRN